MHPSHGPGVGRDSQPAGDKDRQPEYHHSNHRHGDEIVRMMKGHRRLLYADLQQAENQQDAGIHRRNPGKQQEMIAIEFRGTIEDFAKCERAERRFHAWNPLE